MEPRRHTRPSLRCHAQHSAAWRGRSRHTLSPPIPLSVAVTVCAPGAGGATCATCGFGFFSPGGNATFPKPDCTACPAGQNTTAVNATSQAACNCERRGVPCEALPRAWAWMGQPSGSVASKASRPPPPLPLLLLPPAVPICRAGYGGPNCGICPQGYWSAGGNATVRQPNCTQCNNPGLYTTAAAGATVSTACNGAQRTRDAWLWLRAMAACQA